MPTRERATSPWGVPVQVDVGARYGDVLLHSLDAIVGTEEPGGICVFSRSAQRIFGWSEDEVLGKPLDLLLRSNPGWGDSLESHLGATSDPEACFYLTGFRRDGTTFPACVRISTRTGLLRVRTAIIRDMSARDAVERELLQAQKMASIGLLAASVAHDFNNALTALEAQLYVSELQLGPSSPVAECQVIVDRCRSLTSWLLEVASPCRNLVSASDAVIADLGRCVGDAVRIVGRLLPSNISVRCDLAGEEWLVRVESNLIAHAVINLLMNACDALPEGGLIEVGIAAAGANHCRLTVADTGSGMTPDTSRRAFEPFFTTKPAGRGTGLGLPSVRRIVESARGSVAITSELGKGTLVTVELPRAHSTEVCLRRSQSG